MTNFDMPGVRKETIMNVIVTMSKCPLTTLKVGGGGGPGGGGGGIGILTLCWQCSRWACDR